MTLKGIDVLVGRLEGVVKWFIIIFLCMMTTVIVAQVFCRYLLGFSLSWSEEFARFLLVWLSFIGSGLALKKGELIGVTFAIKALPEKIGKIALVLGQILINLFLVLAIVQGITLVRMSMDIPSSAMRIPMAWSYLSIPVGCLLMGIENTYLMIQTAKR